MSMRFILFPGRHHIITEFQVQYLSDLVASLSVQHGEPVAVVWAITSANHTGTRRNPLSGMRRLGMVEYAAASMPYESYVYTIHNMRSKPDFAHFLIEEIRLKSHGAVEMTPENTTVACSTPAVIAMYRALGFAIAPVELDEQTGLATELRPWDIVEKILRAGASWEDDDETAVLVYPACWAYYQRYRLGQRLLDVYADPLIDSEEGDITQTRDYATYRQAFEENAWRKVADFADAVQPGNILDIGCATGQTIKLLSERPELFESDFYGVEVAHPLFQVCQQRRSAGEFGDANVYFYQRNIMQSTLLPNDYFQTIITMALTHEVESYMGRSALDELMKKIYDMLAPGGVYINYDVVGPEGSDDEVYVRFRQDDGSDKPGIAGLSTDGRFRRFVDDFRREEGEAVSVRQQVVDGVRYEVMSRATLCEFLAKKDYVDSWQSEMHERFCFFTHRQWVAYLERAGFTVLPASRAITNPWLIEHRFAPAAEVYRRRDDQLVRDLSAPHTNTLLIAQKPLDAKAHA